MPGITEITADSAPRRMTLNMGPQHPSTHGVLRVVLKIDGERVVDLDPVLGYLHRGVEKICENGQRMMNGRRWSTRFFNSKISGLGR